MSPTKLDMYRAKLEQTKYEMIKRVEALNKDKTRQNGAVSADWSEQAIDIENDEVVDGLEDLELMQLKKINSALLRIDSGDYGNCANCGNKIADARLDAMPYALLCIDCAQ